MPELMDFDQRGERLPCGCDAHALLHELLAGPLALALVPVLRPRPLVL